MAKRAKKKAAPDPLAGLPTWARELADRYYTRTVSTFLLSGAVRDLQPLSDGEEGESRFGTMRSFLTEELFGGRDHVLYYDRSSGVRAATQESQQDLSRAMSAYDTLYGTDFARSIPRDPGRALQILENYARVRLGEGQSIALVLDFAETLVPAGELSQLSNEDRYVLTTLLKWGHDPQFLAGDVSIVLITENLADISPRLTRSPYCAAIEVPLPDEQGRRDYVRHKLDGRRLTSVSSVSADGLARMTAGLSRLHLDRILTEATQQGTKITADVLKERKKDIIQAECHGLLEFIEPDFNLDNVAGHDGAKVLLRQAASALRAGRNESLPMGYLVAGPVGTGKTFMVTCFAGEIGIPCVKLLNFRSQWQGATEANLEKIFNVLKALWPVAVMIDEADAFLGDRSASGDSGTSGRVFASIASFMGDTTWRGRIVWFLLTSRPDMLPVDLKRQGRAEEHLALFYPETDEERDTLFRVATKKAGIDPGEIVFSEVARRVGVEAQLSGADIEAVAVRAQFRAVSDARSAPTEEDLSFVLEDFIPPSYPLQVELQNLVAVQECTRRSLLPERFRSLDTGELEARIKQLRARLAE